MSQPATTASEPITVRRLSLADLPQVMLIERRSFAAPWSLAMFGLEVSKASGISLVALQGERIVGYLVCSRYADVWHLMNVAVDPDMRRAGVAGSLIEEMLEQGGRDARYTLEVRISNHVAIEMYERIGFRRAGRRRRYYHDNGEDALIMWLGDPGFIG